MLKSCHEFAVPMKHVISSYPERQPYNCKQMTDELRIISRWVRERQTGGDANALSTWGPSSLQDNSKIHGANI